MAGGRGKKATAADEPSTIQVAIRLPMGAIRRAEAIRGKSKITVTRANVLREAVMRGLEVLEREYK